MIKSKITLKQLEALVYVADTGSFRKAAAALGTTQPNISVRIAAIEDTLKVVLMHRDAGSVQLTERGTEMLSEARKVLRAAENLLNVADRRELVQERLRLGVTELVASTWLHDFLRALKAIYPAIRVELTVDLSYEIENHLTEGQLDLAILTEPFRTKTTGLVAVGSYRYGWVATAGIAKTLGKKPEIGNIFSAGILTHGKHTLASVSLRAFLKDQGLHADQIIHSSSLAAALHMAVDGMGIALLPRQLFKEHIASRKLVEIDGPWEPDPLQFFSRFDAKRAPLFVKEAASLAATIAQQQKQ